VLAAAAIVLIAAACSSSNDSKNTVSTTLAPTTTAAVATTLPTPTSVPLQTKQTPITAVGGAALGTLTAVDGRNTSTVPLPDGVGSTAIVHARYTGTANFQATSVDAAGLEIAVLARSVGSYDGTFPVGFVNQKANPVAGIRVVTTGAWHLDIGGAALAPPLTAPGVSGVGDAVLGYTGPQVRAHVTYPGTSAFQVSVFANGAVRILVHTSGPYDGRIQLPAGPTFISVTAEGNWSMTLG
jgi:hypothetical protein